MRALDQATELQNQAIAILLSEREAIDERLAQLGYGEIKTAPMKKRGRPPKQPEIFAQPYTTGLVEP
jgi:hypothetical protein